MWSILCPKAPYSESVALTAGLHDDRIHHKSLRAVDSRKHLTSSDRTFFAALGSTLRDVPAFKGQEDEVANSLQDFRR